MRKWRALYVLHRCCAIVLHCVWSNAGNSQKGGSAAPRIQCRSRCRIRDPRTARHVGTSVFPQTVCVSVIKDRLHRCHDALNGDTSRVDCRGSAARIHARVGLWSIAPTECGSPRSAQTGTRDHPREAVCDAVASPLAASDRINHARFSGRLVRPADASRTMKTRGDTRRLSAHSSPASGA